MTKAGKRLRNIYNNIDRGKLSSVSEAIQIIKFNSMVKFNETVEISINLNVNPKRSEQMVRGVVSLPYGTGKSIRVAVFAKNVEADEARLAGAEVVGAEDLMEEVKNGRIDFNRLIATPEMMVMVSKLGKVLGPRGLMPNPKLKTVTRNTAEAVKLAKAGQLEFRVEKAGIVHAGIGKVSFPENHLVDNAKAFINAIINAKPLGIKGSYIRRVSISSTMGPSIKVDSAVLNSA
ncbi:50S ribosomal protein L1 [Candidatus Endolissoclinum faulkneri]|uniref:50S ribosomal protein L1 n=1 Tax=Candidatus Endolissoclinum faulkneri TaxID=1263979 RepID=UPI0005C6FE33|nr:50S ribosomal protein L1 [Candidatus Endolissoclinum faulkneri]